MTAIATADLHLNKMPRDSHRWGLFKWLRGQVVKHGVKEVLLLGDITDAKDHHGAELVNRLVSEVALLSSLTRVVVLRGNHDGIDPDRPFFVFMNHLPQVEFITKPLTLDLSIGSSLFLPCTDDYAHDWAGLDKNECNLVDLKSVPWIFTHVSFDGCLSENGTRMGGVPPSFFNAYKGRIISGDIHQPQTLGRNITYIGAPYHVRFGDAYEPRVLMLHEGGELMALHFPTKRKYVIEARSEKQLDTQLGRLKPKPGDQVDVRIYLRRSELPEWPKMRMRIHVKLESLKLEVFGPKPYIASDAVSASAVPPSFAPVETLENYINAKRLNPLVAAVGHTLLQAGDEA
jgi:hypothetical protein